MRRGTRYGVAVLGAAAGLALFFALRPSSSERAAALAPTGPGSELATSLAATQNAPPSDAPVPEPLRAADAARSPIAVESELATAPEAPAVRGLVRVHLVDERGATIEQHSTQVGATRADGLYVPAARDEPGRYGLRLPSTGTWRIRARAPGFAESWTELEVASLDEERDVELTLASVPTLRVLLLTPTGEAFENARPSKLLAPEPIATREPPGRWLEHDRIDPERCADFVPRSSTDLDLRYLGLLELRCEPPLWVALVLGTDVLDSRRVEPGEVEVAFELDPENYARDFAELRLRLVDATSGEYLPHVSVFFRRTPHSLEIASEQSEDGLRFQNVPAGPRRLELSAPDHASRTLELVLERGELRDLGDVALEPESPGRVRVHIKGADGVGIVGFAHASVEAWNGEGGSGFRSWDTSVVAGGEAELELRRGRFVVWAEGRDPRQQLLSPRQLLDVGTGTIDVELELGRTAALVLEAPGRPLQAIVSDDTGLAISELALEPAAGAQRVELVPGEYDIDVRADGTAIRRLRITLPPEGASVRVD